MTMNDTLAVAMNNMLNAEKIGKSDCLIKPNSKVTRAVLDIMKEKKFIADYEIIKDGKGDFIKVLLNGNINRCGVVKPRFSMTKAEFEKFEKRFLPAKDLGYLIVSTSKGIMTHADAREKAIGGKLLAYVY